VIASALKKRFKHAEIVNVTGIRRQESTHRSKMPVSAPHAGLTRKTAAGLTWNAIIEWPVQDVVYAIHDAGLSLHEAYTKYGTSRVSCAFCIMSSEADLIASSLCKDNHEPYIRMVELEAKSTFAFQGNRWLSAVAPHILPASLQEQVEWAKATAQQRQLIEAEIPEHLLYEKGWPTCIPTQEEAALLASVRRRVSTLLGLDAQHLDADSVRARYAALMAIKEAKGKGDVEDESIERQGEFAFC
jgi:3'-phosphoadenosine 5'-phosphosulfate sulfotransferase (PAPS reductase)/FAD synthetase